MLKQVISYELRLHEHITTSLGLLGQNVEKQTKFVCTGYAAKTRIRIA